MEVPAYFQRFEFRGRGRPRLPPDGIMAGPGFVEESVDSGGDILEDRGVRVERIPCTL